MKQFLILSFSFLFLNFAPFASAQDVAAPQDTSGKVKKEIATFASYNEPVKKVPFATPFDLTIDLQKPATLEPNDESDFEIINIDNQNPDKIVLTVVPFNLGISTFTATLIDDNGTAFALPDLPLEIAKIKTKYDGQKLLDIRGPKMVSLSWLLYLFLVLLILGLIIYFIYRYKKNKQKQEALKIANPYLDETKTPEEVALAQIDSLLLKDLWQTGQYKLFYIYLTDILRDYLTARFGFEAHKFTTKDLLRYIKKRQDFKAGSVNPLSVFLKSSDFVKFAKAIPTIEQRERNLSDIRSVIKENALPKPTEEPKTKEVKK